MNLYGIWVRGDYSQGNWLRDASGAIQVFTNKRIAWMHFVASFDQVHGYGNSHCCMWVLAQVDENGWPELMEEWPGKERAQRESRN